MALRRIGSPSTSIVKLADVKDWLLVTATASDAMLTLAIDAAMEDAENLTKRSIRPSTWELTLDAFPTGGIELPRPPLGTATTDVNIQYTDSSGSTQTLASTSYYIDVESEPGWLTPAYSTSWPNTYDVINAVKIRYKAGYSTVNSTAGVCPENIKTWVKMRVGAMYEQREALTADVQIRPVPRPFLDGLLDPHKIIIMG